MKSYKYIILIAVLSLQMAACTKDYTNPGAATDEQVFSSPQGLTGVAIGLQRVYNAGRGSSLYNRISIDGLLTNQLIVLNQGNTAEFQLVTGGGSVDGTNTMLAGLWTTSNKIIYDADNVIENASKLADKAYASGLIGYASVMKALALADLAMFWQQVPASIGVDVSFVDRKEGFTQAIAVIDNAISLINTTPISTAFINNIPAGVDIPVTLRALRARFNIFIGQNQQALSGANAVDLTKKSVFNYNTTNLNPIFETATSTNNVYAPGNLNMGLPASLLPAPDDNRISFYISTNPSNPIYRVKGFGAASTTPWPVFLPGEMTLIKAEAYARTNDITNATIELNKILTKTPANDPYGVGANLPPVASLNQQQLLDQIYKNRCIELYMSGLKMEDMRRFGRPDTEKKRNFMPYPFQERDNNPNTPPDPTF